MKSLTARVAVLSAALLGLTGCSALPTPHAFTDRVDAVADSAPAPAGAVRLSAGKRYGSFEEPTDVSVAYALDPSWDAATSCHEVVAVLEDAGWEVDVDDNSLSADRRPLCDPRHHFVVVADDDQETRLNVDVTRRRPPDTGYQLQYGADTSP